MANGTIHLNTEVSLSVFNLQYISYATLYKVNTALACWTFSISHSTPPSPKKVMINMAGLRSAAVAQCSACQKLYQFLGWPIHLVECWEYWLVETWKDQ